MRHRLLPVIAVFVMALAACGDGGETTAIDDEPAEETADNGEAETDPEAPTDGPTVQLASSEHGEILVDGEGMTLYVFLPDDQGEPTCTDECADTWPVFEGEVSAGEGVDGSMLDTTEHPSGTTQATYNGWPLYYFTNDQAAGDVNGQGVGENWYVIGADGEPVRDEGDASAGY